MKPFSQWLEDRKGTALKYKGLLQDVPQDPTHHPEGSVLTHSKMVRNSVQQAIQTMQNLDMPILSNIDFTLSPDEFKILSLAIWLHDIGKHSATEVQPSGKITSYGHQDPEHFLPQIEKFADIVPPETKELYLKNKELIDFLISHHMDFMSKTGFSKSFRHEWLDHEGKLKNDPKIKLLLILMMADKMGRGEKSGETRPDVLQKAVGFNQTNLNKTYDKALKKIQNIARGHSEPFKGDIDSFVNMLKSKGLDDEVIKRSVLNKFGVKLEI